LREHEKEQIMSFDLVLFGGTGDLAWRKIMPALFQAFRHGTLPRAAASSAWRAIL
jgi:glucose-6-phosphate 1-dehydrogenase